MSDKEKSVDADINITVKIPQSEIDELIEELKYENGYDEETDEPTGEYTEEELSYKLADYIESNLDVSYTFGDAWVCSVDNVSIM